jgi:hypothetical protein
MSETSPADRCPKLDVTYSTGPVVTPAAAPTFAPPAGSYLSAVDVSMASTTAGAVIRYTTNGTDPTPSSTQYTSPIHVTATTTFKARAYADGYDPSDVTTATYTIEGTIAAPQFSPPPGTYNSAVDVTITSSTSGAAIRYTTNGSDPTGSSPLYSTPIHITTTTTLKAIGTYSGLPNSPVTSGLYRIDSQTPVVSSLATVPTQVYQGVEPNVALTATASDATRGDSDITEAEYFIGSDPGAGNGIAMSAADGDFDSPTEGILATVPTTGWVPPQMKINVRAKDGAGNWSTAASIFVTVRSSTPPGAVINLSVQTDTAYTLAPIAGLTVTGEYPGMGRENLTDGSIDTVFQSAGTVNAAVEEIVVDLASLKRVGALALVSPKLTRYFPTTLTIETSQNGSDWQGAAESKNMKAAAKTRFLWEFEPRDARYLRVRAQNKGGIKTASWLIQIAEIEIPQSMATTSATLNWTAPADDGYAGSAAEEYILRWSRAPINETNWALATRITIPDPAVPGTAESEVVDLGDTVGKVYFAIKTQDADGNVSTISNIVNTNVGGLRMESIDPTDGEVLTASAAPVYYFNTGSAVTGVVLANSASRGFPSTPIVEPDGSKTATYRQGQKPGSSSWKLSAAQWKKVKTMVGPTGSLYWRPEGKAKLGGISTVVFGPSCWMYFDTGSISGLTVSGAHDKGGKDALYPTLTPLPAFSWTNETRGMTRFYVDVSINPEVPISERMETIVFGGAGIVSGSSYTLTTADWKKLRKLARASAGQLYWRVRAFDADKALDCGSAVKELIIDSGNWVVGDLDLTQPSPSLSWSTDGAGVVGYLVEFSINDEFAVGARSTLKVPTRAVTVTTYPFSEAEVTKLAGFARANGVTTLYYRVRGQDADSSFLGASPAKTTPVPAL